MLIPELEQSCGAHGQVTSYEAYTYYLDLDAGNGRTIPAVLFKTDCTQFLANNYYSDVYDGNDSRPVRCYAYRSTDGTDPCPYDCRPKIQDAINWQQCLPETWEEPQIVFDSEGTVFASDDENEIWWY